MKLTFRLRRFLVPTLSLLVGFSLIVFIINLPVFDEELNPEIVQLMQTNPEKQIQGNAVYAIWGLSAASDQDIYDTGIQLLERYHQNFTNKNLDEITEVDYEEILGGKDLDDNWSKDFDSCSALRNTDCVFNLSNQLKQNPQANERLELMLERYAQIINMPLFNPISLNSHLPSYLPLIRLNQIYLARAFNTNSPHEFTLKLAADLKFWKMMLRQSNTLIEKLIAVVAIWSDIQNASAFISQYELNQNDIADIDEVLINLSTDELDISESLVYEAVSFYKSLYELNSEQLAETLEISGLPLHWLIQKNATSNLYHQTVLKQNVLLAQLTSKELYHHITNKDDKLASQMAFNYSISSLYNLGGKILLPQTFFDFSEYIARVHDLNGMITLVKLQLSLKGVPSEQIQSIIDSSKFTNQYTNQPMNYQPENNKLSFDCLSQQSICSVQL